jgi:hypothetical protein
MRRVVHGVATAVALMAFAVGPAQATGAIAVDDEDVEANDAGFGWATGAANRKEAEHRAIEACHEHGNDTCKVVVWFEGCGAYAASAKRKGIGWGETREIAKQKAMADCGSDRCRILVAECDQ